MRLNSAGFALSNTKGSQPAFLFVTPLKSHACAQARLDDACARRTGLLVSFVVSRTVSYDILAEDFFTEGRVVDEMKNIFVLHPSVEIQDAFPTQHPIDLALCERVSVSHKSKGFLRLYVANTGFSDFRAIFGDERRALIDGMKNYVRLEMKRWGFASINNLEFYPKIGSRLKFELRNANDSHPSTLINVESLILRLPLTESDAGINNSRRESRPSGIPYRPLYAVILVSFGAAISYYIFCVTDRYIPTYQLLLGLAISFLAMAYGWCILGLWMEVGT